MPNTRKWTLPALIAIGLAALLAVGGILLRSKTVTPVNSTATDKFFEERAQESGLDFRMRFLTNEQGQTFKVNLYDHGSGVAVGDFDGDGYDDIYFVNQLGSNVLYRNKGDGTFEDVTDKAGVGLGDRICVSATFADYDNDGHQDLFVTSTRGGNVLFHNQGNGTFVDVTRQAGLTHVGHSQSAVFFDYDNDGYLDLLLINTASWTTNSFDPVTKYFKGPEGLFDVAGSPKETNILYHNNRNGTFTDVTEKAGLKGKGWGADVAVFDYNGDGYLDVLVTCMFGPSQLYRNNGNGTFTEVTRETLGRTPAGGMGARVFDFNNDGKPDLYIVDMHSDMWNGPEFDLSKVKEKRKNKYMWLPDEEIGDRSAMDFESRFDDLVHLPYPDVIFGNAFYKNLGNGKFLEISDQANLETFWPWGIATGDFDNDGFEDVFIPSGMGYPWDYWPNRLMMNNGNETFSERSASVGMEPPARGRYLDTRLKGEKMARSSRAAAVADFDHDGRLEIVVNNFNDTPYYFRNRFPPRNYVAFRLQGTRSNRDAIGAIVQVHTGREVMTRYVQPAGGFLSQSSKDLHFGLGTRTSVERVDITWPSGLHQQIDKPEINRLHQVKEQ
jgi:hypothetical protein